LLVVIATVVLLSACGARGDRQVSLARSSRSTTSVLRSEVDAAGRSVVGVYRQWLLEAHETSVDPVGATSDVAALRARLGRIAGPTVVDAWVRTLLDRAVNGIAERRERRVELVDVERVTVMGDTATLVGCVRDAAVLYKPSSGAVVNAAVGFDRVTLGFVRDGSWKFDRVIGVEVVQGCRAR